MASNPVFWIGFPHACMRIEAGNAILCPALTMVRCRKRRTEMQEYAMGRNLYRTISFLW